MEFLQPLGRPDRYAGREERVVRPQGAFNPGLGSRVDVLPTRFSCVHSAPAGLHVWRSSLLAPLMVNLGTARVCGPLCWRPGDFDPGGLVLMSGLLRHGLDGDASALLDFDVQAVAI